METNESLKSKFTAICEELAVGQKVEDESWENYNKTVQVYALEGPRLEWLCCSLAFSCGQATLSTVQDPHRSSVRGNGVSFNNILRKCNIGFREFFTKIQKWNEMNSVPETFRLRIERLQKNFENTIYVYKKYGEIFQMLFICPARDEATSATGASSQQLQTTQKRKKEKIKCTAKTLFEFCWCLFASVKGELSGDCQDLIMYHNLLLCCIDLMYSNALAAKRSDLINPTFRGVPEDWETAEATPTCILQLLCENTPYVNALEIKRYAFRNSIVKLFNENVLKGDKTEFLDLLSPDNFDKNYMSINARYDHYVLTNGEIDEKLFLVADEFGVDNFGGRHLPSAGKVPASNPSITRSATNTQKTGGSNEIAGRTPIGNMSGDPSAVPMSPLSTATDSIKRLIDALGDDREISPPPSLIQIFKKCQKNPLRLITDLLESNKLLFNEKAGSDYGHRWGMVLPVFYRLLENIYKSEERRRSDNVESIFQHEHIINALCACSVEIVSCAYGNPDKFPWILSCFNLSAFIFYRIIEPVVSAHGDLLTRNIIDHLKRIEEQCLDSYVWKNESELWSKLQNYSIPKYEDSKATMNGNHLMSPRPYNGGRGSTSMIIFFRKFYMLAYKRIMTLCEDLEFKDPQFLQEIWTIFEYSVVNHVILMRRRHMDQLIMCSVYVYVKVKRQEKKYSFKVILQKYRNQPHSVSHIYRNVSIDTTEERGGDSEVVVVETNNTKRATRQMDEVTGQAVTHHNEIWGDIIEFYNSNFVSKVELFALKFAGKDQVSLSPSPVLTRNVNSPRKVSNRLTVTTKEKDDQHHIMSPITYTLDQSSPSQLDYIRINQNISNMNQGKRSLFDTNHSPNVATKKFKTLITDRNATGRRGDDAE